MRQFDSVAWLAAGIRAAGIGLVLVWLVQALRVSRAGA
jgi:hypothetical protein